VQGFVVLDPTALLLHHQLLGPRQLSKETAKLALEKKSLRLFSVSSHAGTYAKALFILRSVGSPRADALQAIFFFHT
jgi:hypothetical protein